MKTISREQYVKAIQTMGLEPGEVIRVDCWATHIFVTLIYTEDRADGREFTCIEYVRIVDAKH